MKELTETLIGKLSLDSPNVRLAFLVDRINEVIKPPKPATVGNVNIRAMYVVNDLVNSHGGRFRRQDLVRLAALIADTPVLIGHNRNELPLARTFHAELEERGNVLWLKSYFYWPKAAANSQDDLLLKIDSGILKECSISFVYTFPECSVCGDDIRTCPHDVDLTGTNGDISRPHFIYNGITQVLETSLVYKGSVKGTYVTDRLSVLSRELMEPPVAGRSQKGKLVVLPLHSGAVSLQDHTSVGENTPRCIASFRGRHYMLLKSE